MYVRLVPVCDCGYMFHEGITLHDEIEEADTYMTVRTIIDPYRCPSCGEIVEGVWCNSPCSVSKKVFK